MPPDPESTKFGELLRRLRQERGLSGSEMARRAKIQQPQYSDYEHGHRKIGSKIAEKLANALALTGDERSHFVHCALMTGRRPHVGESFQFYHPAILEAVAGRLRVRHIGHSMILKALLRPLFIPGDENALKMIERLAKEMKAKATQLEKFVARMRAHPPEDLEPIPTDLMITLNSGKAIMVDVTVMSEE